MSVLLKKVLWFRYSDIITPINITDSIDYNIGRGLDIKNNVLVMTLKNPAQSFNSAGNKVHKYIDDTGVIKFEEQDQVKIYLKYTDDMADVESVEWNNDSTLFDDDVTSTPSSDYLKGVYYVIEFDPSHTIKGTPIKVKCADKAYILFSRLLAKAYIQTDGKTAPQIIQKIIRFATQDTKGSYLGTGEEPNVTYGVDAKLEDSEGGFIQESRKTTTEGGATNSDTSFPEVVFSKVWKPVYEWINELSQLEYINTADEIAGTGGKTLVYGRPFLYFVDENNRFHWFETDNSIDETVTIGTTEGIYEYKLIKKVFDTVNFIIFRGGEDFYGKGTLDYYFDETTNLKTIKMRVIAMVDVAKNLIQKEIRNGNLVSNTSGTFTFGGNRYNRNGNVTPHWNSTLYTSDATYNTSLRTEIISNCNARARSLSKGLGHARYKGTLVRKGGYYVIGNLLNVTNIQTGQVNELLRVMEVRDNVDKGGWSSSLSIEQDQKAIIAGA